MRTPERATQKIPIWKQRLLVAALLLGLAAPTAPLAAQDLNTIRARAERGENPFQLDSSDPKIPLQDYIYTETRYRMLQQSDPEVARFLLGRAQEAVNERWRQYKQLAAAAPAPTAPAAATTTK